MPPVADAVLPIVVLDTNVVLDWLVFRNPTCAELGDALGNALGEALGEAPGDTPGNAQPTATLRWCASPAMREELAHVLGRGRVAQAWKPDLAALWTRWERHCVELAAPTFLAPAMRLRCTDADDQMFIDFSLAHGARFLLSRDRAVLKLARRARPFGLTITTPSDWAAARSAST